MSSTKQLETNIAELEAQLRKKDTKIRKLTTLVSHRFSPFDDPLDQFYYEPEYWDELYEDTGACHYECYKVFRAAIAACGDDVDCRQATKSKHATCHEDCDD
jgi:hypothetical protein